MGWDDEGNFWWEDSEEREASETAGAAVHSEQQEADPSRRKRGFSRAGQALPAVLSLHYSGRTQLPPRKSTSYQNSLWYTTPLETATNPSPASLGLVSSGGSPTAHALLSGDFCQLNCAPRADDCKLKQDPHHSVTTNCRQTSQTSRTHTFVFAPLSSLGTN